MRPYIILAIIGVIVAGLAALAVRSSVTPPEQAQESAAVSTSRILIAKSTIPIGTFIQADRHLSWSEWPADKVQSPPYIVAGAHDIGAFNGAVTRRTLFAGEPVSQSALVKPGEGGFMSAVLQAGKRAVSIPVNPTTGNAGFIFPGDSVDLILTHTVPGTVGDNFVSETFVRDVRVLAVDQALDNPENKALLANTVTLEVSPRQAEAITVALEMGRISLALRSLAADPEEATAAEAPYLAAPETVETMGIDYFYPSPDLSTQREFTRDSDISKLLGKGGDGPARVRVIRGENSQELQFDRLTP